MASSAVTQSMRRITATKLDAVSRQQASFEESKAKILNALGYEDAAAEHIRILLDGLINNKITTPVNISTTTIRAFLEQSKHDPSVSASLLQSWEVELRDCLDTPSRKYQHALLFGRLAMEWLESSAQQATSDDKNDSFEAVGRKEMHEQRKEWENLVLNPKTIPDAMEITTYLAKVFAVSTESQLGLKTIRQKMKNFVLPPFDTVSLRKTIKHLLASNLLSLDKQAGLRDLRDNALVISEMADVLNMQIDNLPSWSWGEPPALDVRRALNGKYRVFMDGDILQAVLLQYIGIMWAAHLKEALIAFMESGAWRTLSRPGSSRIVQTNGFPDTVQTTRHEKYKEYFMQQLPSSLGSTLSKYDHDADSDIENGREQPPSARKQGLFHLVSTEALMTSTHHESFTVLQSDFEWFGPSLPHTTMLTVLKFFEVPSFWLEFLEKFLQTPMRFVQDGPNAEIVVRKSGVPISHTLSDFMSEAVLFCLDFTVNHESGGNLYRIHDDLWFWGSNSSAVAAWKAMGSFNRVMKMRFNDKKTGSVQINADGRQNSTSAWLPRGPVTWGFLQLGSRGTWQIDNDKIKEHTAELQLQLKACKSIFAWIQAWNVYAARFFATNLGPPSRCLGRAHIDMVIAAFTKLQNEVFSSHGNHKSVTEYLKSELQKRFSLANIPDGLLFFPIELGGLGLQNPLIPLLLRRANAPSAPAERIREALEKEKILYNNVRKKYDEGNRTHRVVKSLMGEYNEFISFEDYMATIESHGAEILQAYQSLLEEPNEQRDMTTPVMEKAIESLPAESRTWQRDAYMQWIVQLYGGDIIKEFGGLALGDIRLLPIGLISMLRGQRIQWQQ
ncbi:uncharacterized protein KY384_005123 [Bacidia gigantensis]|uniref:uncharacterized protein n=1 Tax=Bacidia gigantensis TaxID=2732470 RepID=UPI001D03947C|nr:uncharacterized protein KY384_005123 [Bacidia gigantensis]KAG8529642.1 hypothetical protein KY384_005123 [Bacidia gigantensis]